MGYHHTRLSGALGQTFFTFRAGSAAEVIAARLLKLETARERMRKVASLVRKHDASGLRRLGYGDARIARMLHSDCDQCGGYTAACKMRNTDRKITALRRLLRLLDLRDRRDITLDEGDYTYSVDVAAKYIRFQFAAKPDKACRACLRRAGFAFHPVRNVYERHLDAAGVSAAAALRAYLKRMAR